MDFKDYYATLGVAETATEKIKQASASCAQASPDVNPGTRPEVGSRQRGLRGLGDPEKRKSTTSSARTGGYEQAGPVAGAGTGGGGRIGGGGRLPHDDAGRVAGDVRRRRSVLRLLPHVLRRRRGPSGRGRGRGARHAPAAPRQGRDVEHEIELGARRRLSRHDAAPHDHARRRLAHRRCSHSGRRRRRLARPDRRRRRTRDRRARSPAILYLRIRLAPHPRSSARARTCTRGCSVPLTTAVLGGEAEVRTLSGKSLRLKIPPTTQNGQVFRLKGHGMPTVEQAGRARRSLRDRRTSSCRSELTPEQREHFEALAG